jgi:transposase
LADFSANMGHSLQGRYDKLAANYLAFVKLASIRIWLRANESTL